MSIIYIPDIECHSCVRIITKRLNEKNITDFQIEGDHLITGESNIEHILHIVKESGFRASTHPFERRTFAERFRHFKQNTSEYAIEVKGLQYFLGIIVVLIGLALFSYVGFLRNIPSFPSKYTWWIFYLIISVATIAMALWHFFAYRARVTCMVGMMIGMTFGMQTGMMLGAVLGATNGFFMGALVGMLSGVVVGILTGKCCGIMGVMEGMMAGLMGGTMGPMISVMMFSDHLLWFMPVYMAINVLIVAGLAYMLYEEVVEPTKGIEKQPLDFLTLVCLCIIFTFILSVIMIYGPKSVLLI